MLLLAIQDGSAAPQPSEMGSLISRNAAGAFIKHVCIVVKKEQEVSFTSLL